MTWKCTFKMCYFLFPVFVNTTSCDTCMLFWRGKPYVYIALCQAVPVLSPLGVVLGGSVGEGGRGWGRTLLEVWLKSSFVMSICLSQEALGLADTLLCQSISTFLSALPRLSPPAAPLTPSLWQLRGTPNEIWIIYYDAYQFRCTSVFVFYTKINK